MQIPAFVKRGNKTILTVDGVPFTAIAGEVHNSDYSSLAYMEHIWQTADDLNLNTLLIPMSWDLTEPEEGVFDFSLTQGLIDQARRFGKKIVFLWFGSWKNAECMYAPAWVKRDVKRFRRAQIVKGMNKAGRRISPTKPVTIPYTTLSYLCRETMEADAKAFSAFMGFLKGYDADQATVIAVQVENETGMLGAARDVSDEADALFAGPVPADFAAYMKAHTDTMVPDVRTAVESGSAGSWQETFGDCAEELFSAYYTASYVNFVAEAGKRVFPLPMAVNCWLDKKNDAPGNYPSGGPVSRVHEVWDFCAPAIDVYCPDIYVPTFHEVCSEYTRRGNPLFIPEAATHSYCAPRLVYTIGHHHAVCYSPFGFDDIGKPFTAVQGFLFGMDVNDPALTTPQNFDEYAAACRNLNGLMPWIVQKLGTDDLQADCGEVHDEGMLDFGDLKISTAFRSRMQPRSDGYVLAVRVAKDELYLMGSAARVSFASADPEKPNLDMTLLEELFFDKSGRLTTGRRLNGDEGAMGGKFEAPLVLHVKFVTYE